MPGVRMLEQSYVSLLVFRLLGWFLFEISGPLRALLNLLMLHQMDSSNKGVHHIVQCPAWRQGTVLEYIRIWIRIDFWCDTSQQQSFRVVDGEKVG